MKKMFDELNLTENNLGEENSGWIERQQKNKMVKYLMNKKEKIKWKRGVDKQKKKKLTNRWKWYFDRERIVEIRQDEKCGRKVNFLSSCFLSADNIVNKTTEEQEKTFSQN